MDQIVQATSIMFHFSVIPDPRKVRNQLYPLADIIHTMVLAALCGADDYPSVELWAINNLDWLQSVGICLAGAPSHDTYERFFKYLDPAAFQKCFMKWVQSIAKTVDSVIAIDGKTLCNARDEASSPIHIVSAFATENSLILGQQKCLGKGRELEAIQKLLDLLDIKGATITIDAAGCHKVVVEQIRQKGGDYLLALKGNQGNLHGEVENYFTQAIAVEPGEADCDYWYTEEKSRGKIDRREVWACERLDWLPQNSEWRDLRTIVCVRRTSINGKKKSVDTRYFISSLPGHAERVGKAVRSHWGIENKLHWHLDVAYREDLNRVRKGNGAENLSTVRRATLNLLREDKTVKASMKNRRLMAGWNRKYLLTLIGIHVK